MKKNQSFSVSNGFYWMVAMATVTLMHVVKYDFVYIKMLGYFEKLKWALFIY